MAAAEQRRSAGERGTVEELIEVLGIGYVPPHLKAENDRQESDDGWEN